MIPAKLLQVYFNNDLNRRVIFIENFKQLHIINIYFQVLLLSRKLLHQKFGFSVRGLYPIDNSILIIVNKVWKHLFLLHFNFLSLFR